MPRSPRPSSTARPAPVSPGPVPAGPAPLEPAPPEKPNLRDLSPERLAELLGRLDEKPYRAVQLADWLWRKDCSDFSLMTNIGAASRLRLERACSVEPMVAAHDTFEDDDGTLRIVWTLSDGLSVESVVIAERGHLTLCVSTQVGCRMGCRFCRTATLGFRRHLSQGEILGQIVESRRLVGDPRSLTNVVLMGMGEPLDNPAGVLGALRIMSHPQGMALSPRRLTLSTVGLVPALARLAADDGRPRFSLTVSLGSASDRVRDAIMPVNRAHPLAELKAALAAWPLDHGRRITLAYVMLAGVNDSPVQALELSRFMGGLKAKINLIPFNPWPGAPFERPDDQAVENFRRILVGKNHTALIRRSNGLSVNAACGQLVGRNLPPAGADSQAS